MNREIQYLYDSLDKSKQTKLKTSFASSPKMSAYINLIMQDGLINTNKAVSIIYKEELDNTPRNTLVNRFYKLRNKLRLWFLKQLKDHPICLTKEEQELAFLRLLTIQNEHYYALEQLYLLEETCWQRNLFELLPEVLSLILRCLRGIEQLNQKKFKNYLDKLSHAHELLQLLHLFQYYTDAFNQEQIAKAEYKPALSKLKRQIKPFEQYPRFTILYHFISFSVGAFLEPSVKKSSNALSRHLNQYKQLSSQYPAIPIHTFEPYHREKVQAHFLCTEAAYWYHKQELKKCCACLDERKALLSKHPNLNINVTANLLQNIILFYMSAERELDALEYTEQLRQHEVTNTNKRMDIPHFIFQMVIYTRLFPKVKIEEPYELLVQIKEFIKKPAPVQFWIYESLAEYCIVYEFFEDARWLLEHPFTSQFFEEKGVENNTLTLLNLIEQKDTAGLQQLVVKLQDELKNRARQVFYLHFVGLIKITKHFLKT